MKWIICFLSVLWLFSTQIEAKVVKLGRKINATSYQPAGNFNSDSKLPEKLSCDINCTQCDDSTGQCQVCTTNRYLSENMCLSCPSKNYCDGKNAIPNCTDVACRANSVAEATDAGCCCKPVGCQNVICKSGFSPVASANGCCCN